MKPGYVMVLELGGDKVWALPELIEKLGDEEVRRIALHELIPSRPSATQSKAWYRQKIAEMSDTRYPAYDSIRR